MSEIFHEFRIALRSLRRGGLGVLIAIGTLALGLVGTTAVFAVVQAILLAPLPAEDPERVVIIHRHLGDEAPFTTPIPTFYDWRERQKSFSSIAGFASGYDFNLDGPTPQRAYATAITSGLFETLGRGPALGRDFGPMADSPGAAREVIVSHRLWQERFGGDENALGQSLLLDGAPWHVVGVLPPDFGFPYLDMDLWVPLGAVVDEMEWQNRSTVYLVAVARLSEGIDLARATEDMERVTETVAADTGVRDQPQPLLRSLATWKVGSIRGPLLVLSGAVFFVLLIACANVASLLVVRGLARRTEIAVRAALGARRLRLVRLLLVESVGLALLGSIVALLATPSVIQLIRSWLPAQNVPREPISMLPEVWTFGILMAVFTGLVFGVLPAWRFSSADLASDLRQGLRSIPGRRLQAAVVVAEVALATVLLVGAGLMTRSLDRLLHTDPGFSIHSLLTQRLSPDPGRYPDLDSWIRFHDAIVERVGRVPGVEGVAAAVAMPFDLQPAARVAREGLPLTPEALPMGLTLSVSPSFFDVLDIDLLEGRLFDEHDDLEHPGVALVDRTLAEKMWPGQSAVGQRVAFEVRFPPGGYRPGAPVTPLWRDVIGVVETTRLENLRQASIIQVFVPMSQLDENQRAPLPDLALIARTGVEPLELVADVRAAINEVDPTLPVYDVRSMEQRLEQHVAQERLMSVLLGAFGLLALALSAAGVYAALAHLVTQRRREMGLRMALGAAPRRLLWHVVWQGVRLAVIGVAFGIAGSTFLTQALESRLYGIGRADPLTLMSMPALLLLAACVACLVPALRAARLDPQECLRYE